MDYSTLQFLAAPFVASLIIAGIHAYLGVHVVERGVIFVDLSLAQIAALGSAIALLLPIDADPHGALVYWISVGSTLVGAAIFSTIRGRRARIPQEAIIGIAYAVASAGTILAMSKATAESEHLKDMLVGNILAVSWPEVGVTAALYAVIGVFHFVFRKKFLEISMNHDRAETNVRQVRLWDFLFYASFGFVVTRSVSIAGVLLVFCYLIVPSVAAILYSSTRKTSRHRMDDGRSRFRARDLPVCEAGPAHGRDHGVHVRASAHPDGGGAAPLQNGAGRAPI
jgi:zinc/manganese transport system permease protein